MGQIQLSGKVQTVLGPVRPEELGVTLTHEHLLIDLRCYFLAPEEASERGYIHRPITMDVLGRWRTVWRYNVDNLTLVDERVATEEVMRYKLAGGCSLVDATSIGIGRDPLALARISRATGLNIIMGASYYVPLSHPADMASRSEDTIAEQIVRDITVGVGDTGIRAGIIGEIGCWWPMDDTVRRVLRASAQAQIETGAPILIHPGFHPKSHDEILEVLVKAGADVGRVIMGHLDAIRTDRKAIRDLADAGCFMEWDTFGNEDTSANPLADLDRVNDSQRLEKLEWLIADGHLDKIVVAQDVCVKNHLVQRGGKGYAHILESIVPRMRKRGFIEAQIRTILVDNPRRALTFA